MSVFDSLWASSAPVENDYINLGIDVQAKRQLQNSDSEDSIEINNMCTLRNFDNKEEIPRGSISNQKGYVYSNEALEVSHLVEKNLDGDSSDSININHQGSKENGLQKSEKVSRESEGNRSISHHKHSLPSHTYTPETDYQLITYTKDEECQQYICVDDVSFTHTERETAVGLSWIDDDTSIATPPYYLSSSTVESPSSSPPSVSGTSQSKSVLVG